MEETRNDWDIGMERHSLTQNIAVIIGCIYILLGLAGLLYDGFMGGHFSWLLSTLYLFSGILSFYCGKRENPKYAYWLCLAGASFTGILALAGLVAGSFGYPSVGHQPETGEAYHLVVISGLIELGLVDHLINLALCLVFSFGAWRYKHKAKPVIYRD